MPPWILLGAVTIGIPIPPRRRPPSRAPPGMGMRTDYGMQYGEERCGTSSATTWGGSGGVEKGQQPSGRDVGLDLISSREEHRWQRQGSATTGKRN